MERQEPLRPSAGFCLQAETLGNPPGRFFVNMCKHKLAGMPISYSGKPVSKDYILAHGIGSMQVPFDMGSFRKLKARADGAKQTTYCIDVVFNPLIISLFMDDAFCKTMEQFRPYVINLALHRIEETVGVKLALQSVKLVKELRYKDPEDEDGTVREFTELPGTMDLDEEAPVASQSKKQEPGPLIEDVTPAAKQKPAIKKGFLNKSGGTLYGDEGSKEGVLPENAGDPLGYLPKKLRQTCKIVDTNSPEYQEQEKKKRAADETNAMNKDLRDMLTKDMEKWSKKCQPEVWSQDLPDGPDAAASKYDVDYSRFDAIDDVEEVAAAEKRDYYFDEKGQRHALQSSGALSGSSGGSSSGPAIRKGFLEQGLKPLYPEGSGVREPSEAMQAQFLKEFGHALEAPASSEASTVRSAEREAESCRQVAVFSLSEVDNGEGKRLRLVIEVPKLESMEGVDLDVTERRATVTFPSGYRPLQVELPTSVEPTLVRAKFSRKTKQLSATMPTR